MKMILICWNKSEYTKEIERIISSDQYMPIVCTDFTALKDIVEGDATKGEKGEGNKYKRNESRKDIKGIIVLCELTWNHKIPNGLLSDLNGITLVQEYIRQQKEIKVPILFMSFLGRKHIIYQRQDAKIILTPALQHRYEQLPVKNWRKQKNTTDAKLGVLDKLEQMEDMTELELEYTKLKFCNIDGLVIDVSHFVRGRSTKSEFQKCFDTMEYVIKKKYTNFASELSKIKPLIDSFEESEKQQIGTLFQDLCNRIREDVQWEK